MNAHAQDYSAFYTNVTLKGGYNFLDKQPVTSVSISSEVYFLRFAFAFNYVIVPNDSFQPTRIPTVSPSIGVCYGYQNVAYLMCGAQPFGVWDKERNRMFKDDRWRISLEAGYDIRISDLVFFNISAFYLLPSNDTETEHFHQNFSLMAGIGFRL